MTTTANRLTTAAILLIAALLGGCATPSAREVPCDTTYTLDPAPACDPLPTPLAGSIRIDPPEAPDSLQSTHMYYSRAPFRLERYAINRWCDTPSQMLRRAITLDLTHANLFREVFGGSTTVDTDYRLQSELLTFRQEFGSKGSEAVLDLTCHLLDERRGTTVATRRFTYRVAAPSDDAAGGVQAMNEALRQFSADLCRWLTSSLKKEQR